MTSNLPINRNTDEWDLPKEIADDILASIDAIEAGNVGQTTQFHTNTNGQVERVIIQTDGTATREQLNPAIAARIRTGLSQAQFAKLIGISIRTIQEWEQGRRKPSGAAQALLKIAAARPDIVQEVLSTAN